MQRTPRVGVFLVGVSVVSALVVAGSATGRSQAKPSLQQEPSIATKQAVIVGVTLTGNDGKWNGTEPITYSRQWLRCDENAINCKKITNATGQSYTVVKNDAGHTLRFQVTAQNSDGKTIAESNATGEVPGKANAPAQLTPPAVSGNAVVGQQLTATTGTWAGTQPISFQFAWQTCNAEITSCSGTGKKGNTYTVSTSDVGKRVRAKVTAKNSVGSSTALTDTTAVVAASGGGGGGGGGNSVNVKDVGPSGERLTVDRVVFNPNPVTSRNVPIRVTITVKDTKGRLVQGALVFIRSTPIVSSTPTDAPTGSDATVSYSIQPRSDFPIKNGFSVQFFVKAYRSGDPTLAGDLRNATRTGRDAHAVTGRSLVEGRSPCGPPLLGRPLPHERCWRWRSAFKHPFTSPSRVLWSQALKKSA
jgi:hypothetical protein